MKTINTFDIDGVITVGLYPGPDDVIITGRSFEEAKETYAMLRSKGINNPVYFNTLPFDKKDRASSGLHKGNIIAALVLAGTNVGCHFEDDEIQKDEIEKVLKQYLGPTHKITVVHVVHSLTEKENVRNPWPDGDPNGRCQAPTEVDAQCSDNEDIKLSFDLDETIKRAVEKIKKLPPLVFHPEHGLESEAVVKAAQRKKDHDEFMQLLKDGKHLDFTYLAPPGHEVITPTEKVRSILNQVKFKPIDPIAFDMLIKNGTPVRDDE